MAKKITFILPYDEDVEKYLKRKYPKIIDFRILSESLDARGANRGKKPRKNYHVELVEDGEKFSSFKESFSSVKSFKNPPLIIGAGPAGLFAALRFAEYDIPTILIERGARAHKRMKFISKFWRYGEFDRENNVCFGEGGAGLFSDGKLITRIKSPYVKYVMNKLVEFGAPKETAWVSNPHLGSNKIRQLIGKISSFLTEKGHKIFYETKVESLIYQEKKVIGVKLNDGRELFSDHVILATGHSARDIYNQLCENNVQMKLKDFAVGVRIEHPRRHIDFLQYGSYFDKLDGAARYRLSYENKETCKGTYSFCMCPGGYVLSSGTEANGIVVNGMSNFARNSPWSNSALVVSVKAGTDFSVEHILNGEKYQEEIEQKAYEYSVNFAGGKEIPSQRAKDFIDGKLSSTLPKTSTPSGIFSANIDQILPESISNHLKNALLEFDHKMKGYLCDDALLLAPETRTSAPITIVRDRDTLESTSHQGLYPCGEGAGHAGGITSAAVDGVKVVMAILKKEGRIDV